MAVRRAAVALLVGVSGAWLALLAFGRSTHRLGPFEVEFFARPGIARSVIALPPLGTIEASTHLVPLHVEATLIRIDTDRAAEVVRDTGLRGLGDQVQEAVPGALGAVALRSVLIGILGGALASLLVHRARWHDVARGSAAGTLALVAMVAGTSVTYRADSFTEARYTGSLQTARDLVGPIEEAGVRFQGFRRDLERLVRGTVRAYGVIGAPAPAEDAVVVLHVSDIHSSPLGMDFAQGLATEFDADVVVDTGDLTSFGSPLEASILERIPGFGVPYLFVRGNHDSPAIGGRVDLLESADTLEAEGVTVAGVRFYGDAHPLFTPDAAGENEEEIDAAVAEAGDALAIDIEAEEIPPDVVLLHDGRMADAVVGDVPLVLSGHFHAFATAEEEGTIRLRVGSTGAGGLDTFIDEGLPLPLAAELLYLEGSPARLTAVDRVTLEPEGRALVVEREVFEPGSADVEAAIGPRTPPATLKAEVIR